MLLSQYLKQHKGEVVRIGTRNGAGFVFAGTIDAFTLNHIEAYTHVKMHDREVLEVYPSCFVGQIVIINGIEYGHKDCPEFDTAAVSDDVPIENYQRLIDTVAKEVAQEYERALMTWYCSPSEKAKNNADAEIYFAERFFKSPIFAALMPSVNGDDVLRLIEQKVKKNIGVRDDD